MSVHAAAAAPGRRQWARLIAKVFEVDPLRCPCGGTMRVVAVILDAKVTAPTGPT